ncbi:MAG: hypothetical protein AB1439_10515 [candidate division FCPU426 bacterium]
MPTVAHGEGDESFAAQAAKPVNVIPEPVNFRRHSQPTIANGEGDVSFAAQAVKLVYIIPEPGILRLASLPTVAHGEGDESFAAQAAIFFLSKYRLLTYATLDSGCRITDQS